MNKLIFPQEFLWGSATAAHQVEGNNKNSDWWQWEHSEKRERELRNKNKNPEDYYSGVACDSYNRYEQDFDIAQKLNQNAHRFSIEWARVEPRQGEFNSSEIEHYRKVLEAVKKHGMKTFVTLHHFTNPLWFAELGAFQRRGNIKFFVNYCEKIGTELGDLIDFVCVINEPNIYSNLSFASGKFPPQQRSVLKAWRVQSNLATAHNHVYHVLKKIRPELQVGSTQWTFYCQPLGVLKIFKPLIEKFMYLRFLDRTCRHADFIGLQYYLRGRIKLRSRFPFYENVVADPAKASDLGWEIFPEGLFFVIMQLRRRYNKPIYITENGLADHSDRLRKEFIDKHLRAARRAIAAGADVRGYLHWSLLDNFEWADGFAPRFGLVEIDRGNNLQRKIRPSAYYYAEICKNNYLEDSA